MRIHYALVDDLCSWEEFERLVEKKAVETNGDCSEERFAAREVVKDFRRLHTSVSDLNRDPSLVSFFCCVIEVKKAERFDRPDGGYGFISRILCGDDTGELILTLWDEKAFAAAEISVGDILEVVGRLKRKGVVDVSDLRKPEKHPGVSLRKNGMRSLSPVGINCNILAFAGEGRFKGRDGRDSVYLRLIIGDDSGESEVMFWNNNSPKLFRKGDFVRISGLFERPASGSKRSYSADENSEILRLDSDSKNFSHDFSSRISEIKDGWCGSISAIVEDPGHVRDFVSQRGNISHVRNMEVSDHTGRIMLVIWGEQACIPFVKGDCVDVFFADARSKPRSPAFTYNQIRYEVHAGYGSFIAVFESGSEEISVRGIVVPRNGYFSIDNDYASYPLKEGAKENFKPCAEGIVYGSVFDSGRVELGKFEECVDDFSALMVKVEEIRRMIDCPS